MKWNLNPIPQKSKWGHLNWTFHLLTPWCPFVITLSPHLTSATQTHLTNIKQRSGPLTSPYWLAAAAAKSFQSCPTLCNHIDKSLPGSAVPGILQSRTREWVAISFSNAWKWKVKVKSLSCVRLLAIPWTAAYQAPPSMGFSRQGYWSGVPLPSPLCKGRSVLKLKVTHMSGIPLLLPLKTHF